MAGPDMGSSMETGEAATEEGGRTEDIEDPLHRRVLLSAGEDDGERVDRRRRRGHAGQQIAHRRAANPTADGAGAVRASGLRLRKLGKEIERGRRQFAEFAAKGSTAWGGGNSVLELRHFSDIEFDGHFEGAQAAFDLPIRRERLAVHKALVAFLETRDDLLNPLARRCGFGSHVRGGVPHV
jgi:hypothetical protein